MKSDNSFLSFLAHVLLFSSGTIFLFWIIGMLVRVLAFFVVLGWQSAGRFLPF